MAPQAYGDTVKTKEGKTIQGTIIAETVDSVTIEFADPDIKGIMDTKTFKKTDVTYAKTAKDVNEAIDLLQKFPQKDSLALKEYEMTKLDLEGFIKKYPTSIKRPDVARNLKELTAELDRVKKGDQKVDGVWMTAADLKWNGYNIRAVNLRKQMEKALGSAAYKLFIELETNYVASEAYVDALPLVEKAFSGLEAELLQALTAAPALKMKRDEMLKGKNVDAKKTAQEEIAAYKIKVVDEKKKRLAVSSIDPAELRTINEAINGIKRERLRLSKLDVPKLTTLAKNLTQGFKDLSQKAYLSALKNIEPSAAMHNKDTELKRIITEAKAGAAEAKTMEGVTKKP